MEYLIPIAVALIGGPLMWVLKRFDKRNTHQHAQNLSVLERIEGKVDHVSDRLSDHIDWHLDRGR